jgi:hypothetical protein
MERFKAMDELRRLHIKWVSFSGEPNIERIHQLIINELRYANDGVINVTNGLKQEMMGELVLCGKIRAALGMARKKRQRDVIRVSGRTALITKHKLHSAYRYEEME